MGDEVVHYFARGLDSIDHGRLNEATWDLSLTKLISVIENRDKLTDSNQFTEQVQLCLNQFRLINMRAYIQFELLINAIVIPLFQSRINRNGDFLRNLAQVFDVTEVRKISQPEPMLKNFYVAARAVKIILETIPERKPAIRYIDKALEEANFAKGSKKYGAQKIRTAFEEMDIQFEDKIGRPKNDT